MCRAGMRLIVAAVLLASAAGLGAAPVQTEGKVESVTLYRGQALVTRTVSVEAPAGPVELVVGNLPRQVVPDSLFAEGDGRLDVRAVRFRTRAVGQEPREDIRKLDEQIDGLQQKTEHNKRMQEVIKRNLDTLDRLDKFVAPTMSVELAKGVLDAGALEKITVMMFKKRTELTDASLKLADEAKDLARQVSLLQRQRAKLTSGSSRTVREAVVFIEKRGGGKGELKLNYLVGGAGWSPTYNFRATTGAKEVVTEYNALIHQMTGENWENVKLTLSTASPALSAQPPMLAPFWVTLSGQPRTPAQQGQVLEQYKSVRRNIDAARLRQRVAQQRKEQFDANWELNKIVTEGQALELAAGKEDLRMIQTVVPAPDAGPSITYAMEGTVNLASRSDRQLVRIADTKLPTTFYHVAAPLLSGAVYREAELNNTEAEVLLAGPASVYLDGRFVGRGEIATVARGQTFVVGFGVDSQLRASRQIVDRTERQQGGNREVGLKLRLVLENYGTKPAKVRLMERIPQPERRADVRLTLAETKQKLSEDKLYLRLQRPEGILRWDVEVPAKTFGEEPFILEYSYKLEFDRKYSLTIPGGPAPAEKAKFRKMLDAYEKR